MIIKRLVISLALFTVILVSCTNLATTNLPIDLPLQSQDTDLRFDIELNKSIYAADDDVTITLILTSTSPDGIFVNKRFAPSNGLVGELQVCYTSPGSKPVCYFGTDVRLAKDKDFVFLQNGESIRVEQWIPKMSDYYCKPGICYIQAYYDNEDGPSKPNGYKVWKGELVSNIVTVTVKP